VNNFDGNFILQPHMKIVFTCS